MSDYTAEIHWARGEQKFSDNRYSRAHEWRFDGGIRVAASSAPSVVPVPMSLEAAVDPEEAFIASLSSCHMLWFLALAAKRGYTVDLYVDKAIGTLGKNAEGKVAMLRVVLKPAVTFSGPTVPTPEILHALHDKAHEECYIANSVKTEVVCEPQAA